MTRLDTLDVIAKCHLCSLVTSVWILGFVAFFDREMYFFGIRQRDGGPLSLLLSTVLRQSPTQSTAFFDDVILLLLLLLAHSLPSCFIFLFLYLSRRLFYLAFLCRLYFLVQRSPLLPAHTKQANHCLTRHQLLLVAHALNTHSPADAHLSLYFSVCSLVLFEC